MDKLTFTFCTWRHPGSYVVKLFTWSTWSHCEVLIPEWDMLWGAVWPQGTVGFERTKRVAGYERAVSITIPATEQQAHDVISFVASQYKKPYDLLGVLGLGIGRKWQDDDKWFCSELLAAALMKAEYPGVKEAFEGAWRVTPEMLRDFLLTVDAAEVELIKE